ETPLCDRHASYWWRFPTLLTVSGFAIFGGGFVLFIALSVAEQNRPRGGGGDVAPFACLATVLVVLVWLIVAVILQNLRIRPAEITDRHIELIKVSEAFADAVEEEDERGRRSFGREFDQGPRRRFRDDEPRRDRDDDRYRDDDDERRYQP